MQTGWFKEVRVKDIDSHSVRALLASLTQNIATLVTPRITWPAVQRRQCMKQTHRLRRLNQLGQFLTRIKHARFHRGLTDADYFGNLFDGFAVIVNQVDDLAVLR
jgi:hypothetical protein